jgi:chaperonin cofactor prefoldin
MLDPSSNPLLISAGITTSITCAISGYALYELLNVGPEDTETARVINPQLHRQPISAHIVPNVSAPQSWSVRPGQRPDFMPIASNTPSPEGAVAQTLLVLWKQGKLPQNLAPLMQQVESGIDEFQAKGYLEAARIQATQQDYAKALKYLKQISTDASVHPQAQVKIAEYTEKQTLQATAWMRKANALAQLKDFSGARIYLKQVPDSTPVYPVAQNKMTEYAQTQNVQANLWFEEASKLAGQGKLSEAITSLKRIPLGTSIYTIAQSKITEYSQKQDLKAATPKPTTAIATPAKPPKPETPGTPSAVAKPVKPVTPVTTPTPAVVATPATPSAVAKPVKPVTPVTTPTPTAVATPGTPSAVAKPTKPVTPVTTPTPGTPLAEATPNQTTVANPRVTPPVTSPHPPSVVVTPVPPSAQTLDTHPSESVTSPVETLPNPRAASVIPVNPQIPTARDLQPSVGEESSIAQPPLSMSDSNPQPSNSQTVPTPVQVPTTHPPRPQIRPETLQTPTFIPKPKLQTAPNVEPSQTVSPLTSTQKNNLKPKNTTERIPANPGSLPTVKLKQAPSDADAIWNSDSFTKSDQ